MHLRKMEKRVEKIRMELQQVGEMRPGSLNQQMTVCGRPGCRCQDPEGGEDEGNAASPDQPALAFGGMRFGSQEEEPQIQDVHQEQSGGHRGLESIRF